MLGKKNMIEENNKYLEVIQECYKQVAEISAKTRFISCECVKDVETQSNTELDSKLKCLLNNLKELNNGLIV